MSQVASEAQPVRDFQQAELSSERAPQWRRPTGRAMTSFEAGIPVGIEHIPEESRAVAIHETGLPPPAMST
jgi:hypothetical protein